MTSVPKPLKFLRAHYEGLKTQYSSLPASNANRPALADVLSVLAITSGKEGERESLHYRWALSGSWGFMHAANVKCCQVVCSPLLPKAYSTGRAPLAPKRRAWRSPWHGHG